MKILSVSLDKSTRTILIKLHDKAGMEFHIKLTEENAESFAKVILRKLSELETINN